MYPKVDGQEGSGTLKKKKKKGNGSTSKFINIFALKKLNEYKKLNN